VMNEDGSCGPFLGTGFFAGKESLLVTCSHLISEKKARYAILSRDYPGRLFPAKPQLVDRDTDLACLAVDGYRAPHVLPLAADEDIALNEIVCCFEYGTTVTAGTHISISPASRMGNVTRYRTLTEQYRTAGDHMLELSFPALRGASGAPVIEQEPPHKVWGIITANYASELLPAHVERIVDERGAIDEETKFYLPQALAIHVKHLRSVLGRLS
jgi:S1-C subfamily serine protease